LTEKYKGVITTINSMFDVTGKRVVVTGASRGLGRGMAEGFLESGAKVVLMSKSDRLDETVREFQIKGHDAYAVKGDLSKREIIFKMWEDAMKILGGIDVLITAAGVQRRYAAEDFPLEEWDYVIEVNLSAVFIMNQLAAREMIKQGKGKIINIASMSVWFGGITVPAYTAAKGGIAQMTRALGNEWMSKGINVNAIAPGYMETEMTENLMYDENRYRDISERIPAHRWGKPEDMKGTALFLASSASDYLSGAIIPVDGGYLSR
jgi:2-deoxy-D-gluconate 3-dehydrogenase